MVAAASAEQAGAMNETPTAPPPPAAPPPPPPSDGGEQGPRVTRDEVRDLGRLRRTTRHKYVAGVAGGVARHLDIDPLITRVLFVVLSFFGGAGLFVYGVCWLILPPDDGGPAIVRLDRRSRTVAIGIVGALGVLAVLGDSLGGYGFPWPVAVLGLIVLAVLLARGQQGGAGAWGDDDVTPPPPPGPDGPEGWAHPPVAPTWTKPSRPRRRGPILFFYTVLTIVVALGVLGMVDLAGADLADAAYPITALGIIGAALVLSAFWGRGGGLIALGLVASVATAGSVAAHEIDAGKVEATPHTAAAVESRYALTVGEVEVDLSEVADPENLDGRTVVVRVDLGRAYVRVPRGVDVTVESAVDLGSRDVFGERSDSDSGTTSIDAGPDAPLLTLDITVDVGEIVVVRDGGDR